MTASSIEVFLVYVMGCVSGEVYDKCEADLTIAANLNLDWSLCQFYFGFDIHRLVPNWRRGKQLHFQGCREKEKPIGEGEETHRHRRADR